MTSRTLDERVGARLFFKCETFQKVGAFKARGAFSRLLLLSPEERKRGVVAFSSGNHAQAVALAARTLGVPATIIMPYDAPALKLAATSGYGAEVLLYDRREESREAIAKRLVEERGALLVPPFDDDAVIAGQGTLALELLEDVPGLDVIVDPVRRGGAPLGRGRRGEGGGRGDPALRRRARGRGRRPAVRRGGNAGLDPRSADDRRLSPDDAPGRADAPDRPRPRGGDRDGLGRRPPSRDGGGRRAPEARRRARRRGRLRRDPRRGRSRRSPESASASSSRAATSTRSSSGGSSPECPSRSRR